jgi:hypothetical protein
MSTAALLAEATVLHEPLLPDERVVDEERFVLFVGRTDATVQRLRLGDVERALADVRAEVEGRTTTWEIATHATPADVADRLLELGLQEDERRRSAAMVLHDEIESVPGVDVRRVETVDDFRAHVTITHEVFGNLDRLPAELARIDLEGEAQLDDLRFVRYVAHVDGKPAGAATATFASDGVILHSGSVLPWARGRGAYRALVAARRADAAERGTPTVVTRAGAMSQPILRGLGFEELFELRFLVDAS